MNEAISSFDGEYRFLSNFWPCTVQCDRLTFPAVENAYQAMKSLDKAVRWQFLEISPGHAKRLGRKIEVRADWHAVRMEIMRDLLVQKFSDPVLKQMLKATGDAELIEGNSWNDVFWGVCDGKGENHLGRLLMEIRARE